MSRREKATGRKALTKEDIVVWRFAPIEPDTLESEIRIRGANPKIPDGALLLRLSCENDGTKTISFESGAEHTFDAADIVALLIAELHDIRSREAELRMPDQAWDPTNPSFFLGKAP